MKTNIFKGTIGIIMTGISYFIGSFDGAIAGLMVLITVDFMTGLLSAWQEENLSSKTCAHGIIKKIMYLAMVVVANIIDLSIQANGLIREAIIYFFIATEALSITENAAKSGLPVPPILIEKLEQLKAGK